MEQGEAFEAAVDAIVCGDAASLRSLLKEHPALKQARSALPHRSTLLHYVSANGVEDARQKTPANVVEITEILLDSGADVNAESEAYGGHSTAMNLTATSCHPEQAGVQLELMQLLLDRGAKVDVGGTCDINQCLANGRGQAAAFLAERGAHLDFEGAAGLGRIELAKTLYDSATPQQKLNGFAWACQFGHPAIVAYLLHQGIPADAKLGRGRTGLHWGAYSGHAATVHLLLEQGASVNVKEDDYKGTPLDWALHAWNNGSQMPVDGRDYYVTVSLLAKAGATLDPAVGQPVLLHSDLRMQAALRGRLE